MKKGSHLTSEHRAKISAALKGRPGYIPSQETRAKMKDAWTRRGPVSEATRAKMSTVRKGCPKSPETRFRMSVAMKGRSFSEETRAKLRAANLGHPSYPVSELTRAKLRAARVGYHPSDETKNKISATLWKGGRSHHDGYELIRIHPRFYIAVHRRNMEQAIGRKLLKGEIVHHINRKRMDNRIENLALCSDVATHKWCDAEEARIFFG